MALLNEMKVAQEETIVGYTEFLKSCHPGSAILYCFVEAKDDEIYYSNVMSSIIGEKFETFKCRNKDGVIKVYHLVRNNIIYSSTKSAYFVDKDFDPPINNPRIFETPFYSVENFYVHHSCIRKILHQQFGIGRINDKADHDLCVQLYLSLQKEFHERVLNLNAWLCCHADERNRKNHIQINIDHKIKWQEVVSPNLDSVLIPNYTYEQINEIFDTDKISKDNFDDKVAYFDKVDPTEVFRGKFELNFLVSFLKRFNEKVSRPTDYLCSKRYSTTLQFNLESIITTLSSYAFIPGSLRDYIIKVAA